MHAFVFGAYPTDIVEFLGLGAVWRDMGVGWGLESVQRLALLTTVFSIGVALLRWRERVACWARGKSGEAGLLTDEKTEPWKGADLVIPRGS